MQALLSSVRALVQEADHILIGAGAGMSAAAGIDYTSTARFRKLFPQMYKRGFRNNYELMGFKALPDSVMWGYHAMHVQHVAYENHIHEVYQALRKIIESKNYFVLTSNVDRMFYKNGFNPERIFTPQGDYTMMQCVKPCTLETWDSRPILDTLLESLDPDTHVIGNPAAIPQCPNCGGAMFMNVRGGSWFVEEPYRHQRGLFNKWIHGSWTKRLLLLELEPGSTRLVLFAILSNKSLRSIRQRPW